ncbi:MAG: hypothetical protein AAF716_22170 [Cyanobacteria bacterium P01_D01_bin.1]
MSSVVNGCNRDRNNRIEGKLSPSFDRVISRYIFDKLGSSSAALEVNIYAR